MISPPSLWPVGLKAIEPKTQRNSTNEEMSRKTCLQKIRLLKRIEKKSRVSLRTLSWKKKSNSVPSCIHIYCTCCCLWSPWICIKICAWDRRANPPADNPGDLGNVRETIKAGQFRILTIFMILCAEVIPDSRKTSISFLSSCFRKVKKGSFCSRRMCQLQFCLLRGGYFLHAEYCHSS